MGRHASYALSRLAIVFIWLYHGLIPKLLFRDTTELDLIEKGPWLHSPQTTMLIAGIAEVVLGLVVFIYWRQRWPVFISIVAFGILLAGAVTISPEHAIHAFNPVTLSGSAIFFCLINLNEKKLLDSKPD